MTFHRPTFHQMKIYPNCSPKCQFTERKVHQLFELCSPLRWKNNIEKIFTFENVLVMRSLIRWKNYIHILSYFLQAKEKKKKFIGLCGGWEFGIFLSPTDISSNVTSSGGRGSGRPRKFSISRWGPGLGGDMKHVNMKKHEMKEHEK